MKIIKLSVIAIALVGIVVGLFLWPGKEDSIAEPEYTSDRAKAIKEKIKNLCKEGQWSTKGYLGIESRIHTERGSGNIELQEANSLRMFLYSSSCIYVKDGVDKFFQQDAYPPIKMTHYEQALNYLQAKNSEQGGNSNLAEASKMFSAYRQLMASLSFGESASYSRPLKAYSGGKTGGRKASIQAMPYYKSHFSKNSSIRSKVASIDADMRAAEKNYYDSLEILVEKHYKSTGRMEDLLEDQIRFDEISTSSTAITRLNNFVNNPNK